MKSFKKVLKNKLFYLFIVLGVFVIPIFKFNLQAQVGGEIPERYVQTTSADFNAEGDYTGTESYIILPADKPDGYKIVNPIVIGVATNGDYLTSCQNMFRENPSLYLELDYLDTSKVTNMSWMFRESQATTLDLSGFNTSKVTTMESMFEVSQATTLDLSSFDTSSVTDMSFMFSRSQATTLDLSSFDTSNVTDMSYMFRESQVTTLDLSSFDTSKVTTMKSMFYDSQAITLDLSSFDTSNVTDMSFMFYGSQVTELDLSNFDTSNVTKMKSMFNNSQATTLDLSSFDTSNVTDMSYMFRESQVTTLDLSSFDTSNVTDMTNMFHNSKATIGYARMPADADRFNNSSNKPSTLTFNVLTVIIEGIQIPVALYDYIYNIGYQDGFNDGKILSYDEGYQDGVDDTHDYYDNGLFIPRFTPKGHLMVEYTPSYNEPYFYLYDLLNVGDPFFDFQYTRWLENLFDWAYDHETDFLAINDMYMIPYEHDTHDEMLYKYFFYKYDTDSIYFYNDNGTLLKIVERVDFDYYVYEVPELSQEEQARIDNAYDRGMRDYGYYDSESEEYLTAVEYGDIQYNLGVISTRDRAYLDGFTAGLWDSHRYGYDWVRATYYELIEKRPILDNVRDITSFAFGEGHDVGFNEARRQYGLYFDGRLWLTADDAYDFGYEDGLDDGKDEGYDDGYEDGYEKGYYKGYQVAVDNTYDTIYDDVYKIGYKDGQKTGMNNKFYSGLEKWIVPAIIVVLFFGLLMLFPKNKED